MLRFFTRLFAFIGFLVTLMIVVALIANYYEQKQAGREPEAVVLTLDFDQPIAEKDEAASAISLAISSEQSTPLLNILSAIQHAKKDAHVKGIVARFGATEPSFAQTQEIVDALKEFRSTGKFTYAFGSTYGEFGLGNRTYYLASAFENIWLQPVGSVGLTGLALFEPFGKSALDKIGVKADFMQREEYKSFMDMATRDEFAPPVKQNMQDLIDDLAKQEATGIAENRGWDPARVTDLMAKGPYTDDEALKAGLVTRIGYADELDHEIDDKAGKDAKSTDVDTYLTYVASEPKAGKGTKVALITAEGMIMDKDAGGGVDELTGEQILGADTIATAFDDASEDKKVHAILFRIDSPGGDPVASETIRRALIHAQERGKPVFVSMGDTAASGGYWIAMNADAIVAEPGTLTGSIGVLGGKFADNGLAQKLGITFQDVRTAENAGMWMPAEGFTPPQRERVNALLDNSYQAFIKNVGEARKIPMDKMPSIAKGRVWTGSQAKTLNLVDELGGYAKTLQVIRSKLHLAEDAPILLESYPPPETTYERVQKLLKSLGFDVAMIGNAAVQLHGLQASLAPWLSDAAATRNPIQARLPAPLVKFAK